MDFTIVRNIRMKSRLLLLAAGLSVRVLMLLILSNLLMSGSFIAGVAGSFFISFAH
jgi:hypothetical protein